MDSICLGHFSTGCCQNGAACPHAHRFSELSNPENWVIFHAPELQMLDFLPYKYQSHHRFQSFKLPGTGPLVRFADPQDAKTVAHEFREYYSPAHLPDVLALTNSSRRQPSTAEMAALEALCRRELRLLHQKIPSGIARSSSTSSACSSDFCLSPSTQKRHPLSLPSSQSCDDISSECPSSESGASTPTKRNLSSASNDMSFGSVELTGADKRQSRTKAHTEQRADRSTGIIGVLQAQAAHGLGYVGWTALEQLWGITPSSLDEAVLTYLARKSPAEQEQILLSFAAIDLGAIQNLSAYLNCLIKEHETTSQVCLHFLAGLCDRHHDCRYIHPVGTAGWEIVKSRWGITYEDFDYAVLNYLSKKPVHQQDEILSLFAEMNLKAVKNRSAYLSSMIERYERVGLRKRTRARGGKAMKGKAVQA